MRAKLSLCNRERFSSAAVHRLSDSAGVTLGTISGATVMNGGSRVDWGDLWGITLFITMISGGSTKHI